MVLLLCLFYFNLGMNVGQQEKQKILSDEFLKEKFGSEHEAAFPGDRIYAGGWPDMGSGRYTMAAGYKAWMEINKG